MVALSPMWAAHSGRTVCRADLTAATASTATPTVRNTRRCDASTVPSGTRVRGCDAARSPGRSTSGMTSRVSAAAAAAATATR